MDLPSTWMAYLRSLGNSYIFTSELELGGLVTFVSETKCRDTIAARRQLTLDLCSAQHQRRAGIRLNNSWQQFDSILLILDWRC